MPILTISAREVKPGDLLDGRRVQDAYTCGKKSQTTSINYYDGTSDHFDPAQSVVVTR